jgi:NitT/TauT family transport system substrate-binding protein
VKKWADKYGITISITQINDYVESINQYTAGKFDGVTLTNMDALTIPAAGGVDTTVTVIGSFSNGNDGIVSKKAKTVAQLKGQKINMVELSVSHYLLARALAGAKLKESDVKIVNTSDADIVAAFKAPDTTTVVTWNPQLLEVKSEPGATLVYDSRSIPGEIIDTLALNTETLKDNPNLGKALVGAWYETMALMSDKGEKGKAAREAMAKLAGTDLSSYETQLKTTRMFYSAKDADGFLSAGDPTSFLRLAGIPFEATAPDGARLSLLRVETEVVADVGSVTPHLGGGSFRYDPLPASLVSRRRRLRFVYFDGAGPRALDFAAARSGLSPA